MKLYPPYPQLNSLLSSRHIRSHWFPAFVEIILQNSFFFFDRDLTRLGLERRQ